MLRERGRSLLKVTQLEDGGSHCLRSAQGSISLHCATSLHHFIAYPLKQCCKATPGMGKLRPLESLPHPSMVWIYQSFFLSSSLPLSLPPFLFSLFFSTSPFLSSSLHPALFPQPGIYIWKHLESSSCAGFLSHALRSQASYQSSLNFRVLTCRTGRTIQLMSLALSEETVPTRFLVFLGSSQVGCIECFFKILPKHLSPPFHGLNCWLMTHIKSNKAVHCFFEFLSWFPTHLTLPERTEIKMLKENSYLYPIVLISWWDPETEKSCYEKKNHFSFSLSSQLLQGLSLNQVLKLSWKSRKLSETRAL